MADLVTKLKEDESSGRNVKARSHSKAALVVVDEVGYAPIDRLLHHSVIVNIKGQSYRLRGKGSPLRETSAAA